MDHVVCKHDWGWGSPLVSSVGQMPLGRLIVVDNGDVGTSGNHINIAEVATVGDVRKEEEVWVSTLIQNPKSVAAAWSALSSA